MERAGDSLVIDLSAVNVHPPPRTWPECEERIAEKCLEIQSEVANLDLPNVTEIRIGFMATGRVTGGPLTLRFLFGTTPYSSDDTEAGDLQTAVDENVRQATWRSRNNLRLIGAPR